VSGVTLDAGALIAFGRNDRKLVTLLARVLELHQTLAVPAGVVGQVWRNGGLQSRLSRLLASRQADVEALDDRRAREAGQLCGVMKTSDVIDASVVLCARRRGHRIVTSDPADLRALDPAAQLIVV
jgi:hypothetical protein